MTNEEAVKMLQVTRLMLMDGANQPISDLYYALDMAIEALEQTENSSENPNNCTNCECTDDCTECNEAEHGCKTEPTGYNLSPVEDEPQTFDKPTKCLGCLYSDLDKAFHPCASCVDFGKYVGEESDKDEPQTDVYDYKGNGKWERSE